MLQNILSFLTHLFSSKKDNKFEKEKVPGYKLKKFQEFSIWKDACDEILAKPFPPQTSDFSEESLERDKQVSFSKLSNWEIVCQEILDTQFSHVYYQRCYDELRKRGKSGQDISKMRRLAWYTAGWLNFPMMLWDWTSLDEVDILRAIKILHEKKQISQEKRAESEDFVKLHA